MTRNLQDISKKIDPLTLAIFDSFLQLAEGMKLFVIGAAARDLALYYLYDLKIVRATRDVDLGIHVASWKQYKELRLKLLHLVHRNKTLVCEPVEQNLRKQ